MKYKILLPVVVIFIALATYYYLNQKSSSSLMKKGEIPHEESGEVAELSSAGEDKMTSKNYVVYTKQAFDGASGKKRVLFFYANWCETCRPADANFKANLGKFPEDLILLRVNYNDSDTDQAEKDLAKKYGITYQHTFVQVDKDGKEITRWNGGQIDKLLSSIK